MLRLLVLLLVSQDKGGPQHRQLLLQAMHKQVVAAEALHNGRANQHWLLYVVVLETAVGNSGARLRLSAYLVLLYFFVLLLSQVPELPSLQHCLLLRKPDRLLVMRELCLGWLVADSLLATIHTSSSCRAAFSMANSRCNACSRD